MIVGTISFFSLESFYQQSMLAAMPSQIFLYLVVGSISAVISTVIMDVFYVWRRFLPDGPEKGKKPNRSTLNGQMSSVWIRSKRKFGKRLTLLRIELSLKQVGGKSLKVF